MTPRLDPEEALAGPLYLVAAMLVAMPLVDFVLSVPAAEPSSVQWRFAAVGLFSGYTLMPVLGVAMAFVLSSVRKDYALQRVLVILCLAAAIGLVVLSFVFLRDMGQVRRTVAESGMPAFSSAANRAIIKLLLTAAVLAYTAWRARRMIPAPTRHRVPKPVHVISK